MKGQCGICFVFVICVLFLTQASMVSAGSRVALVIGNSAYANAPLKNPVNDASDIAKTLEQLGFEVILRTDANLRQMDDAVDEFGRRLEKDSVGLFYYAGHGIQARGRNYLIPTDSKLAKESDLKYEAFDAGRVLDEMGYVNNGLNIVILDACRNNPLTRSFRSSARGLLRMSDVPSGVLLAYSTSPGQVAADGIGRNSPYTEQLIAAMQQPGRPLEMVFKDVLKGVKKQTGNQQTPWISSSVAGDFQFVAVKSTQPTIAAVPPTVTTSQVELAFWNSISNSNMAADYSDYLRRFPNGIFSNLAARKLRNLQESTLPQSVDYPLQVNLYHKGEVGTPATLLRVTKHSDRTDLLFALQRDTHGVCWSLSGRNAPYLLANNRMYRLVDTENVTACPVRRSYTKSETFTLSFEGLSSTNNRFSLFEGEDGASRKNGYWNFLDVTL